MFWFTADWHLGHDNVMRHCARPFDGVTEMAETIVRRYNEVVGKGDTCYFLGDTIWNKDHAKYLDQLGGNKVYLAGNHDRGWAKVKRMEIWHFKGETPGFYMCHLPLLTWPTMAHGEGHIHGHSHGLLPKTHNRLDVGVDAWNFYPVDYDTIANYFAIPLDNDPRCMV
jgi:calcineurin-like phosphoesterase family protein